MPTICQSDTPKRTIVMEFRLVDRGISPKDQPLFLQGFIAVADNVVKALKEKEGILMTSRVYTQ